MEIKPTYVTFEQAKLLKEKGFTKENGCACREGWINYLFYFEGKTSEPENDSGYALDTLGNSHLIERPEQWVVVEWLRVNYGICVHTKPDNNEEDIIVWEFVILSIIDEEVWFTVRQSQFNSPQEAYSAAFDYILTKDLI